MDEALKTLVDVVERGIWMDKALKTLVAVVERGICSLRRANRSWNILLNSFFDHLK
jgi:hypothetical protein